MVAGRSILRRNTLQLYSTVLYVSTILSLAEVKDPPTGSGCPGGYIYCLKHLVVRSGSPDYHYEKGMVKSLKKKSCDLWNLSMLHSLRLPWPRPIWARWIHFPAGMGLDNFPLVLTLATEAEDCLVVSPFSFLGTNFKSDPAGSVWRLILDPFCPLLPPLELPISVNDFRNLPVSYGGTST